MWHVRQRNESCSTPSPSELNETRSESSARRVSDPPGATITAAEVISPLTSPSLSSSVSNSAYQSVVPRLTTAGCHNSISVLAPTFCLSGHHPVRDHVSPGLQAREAGAPCVSYISTHLPAKISTDCHPLEDYHTLVFY